MKPIQSTKEKDLERAKKLLEQAEPHLETENFDEPTVAALKEAMELFEKWEVKDELADVYSQWGTYIQSRQNFKKAIDYYKKSLDIYRVLHGERHESVADAYRLIGGNYACLHEFSKAQSYLEKALELTTQLFGEQHFSVAKCYDYFGSFYFFKQDFKKATTSFLKSLAIIESTQTSAPYIKAHIHANLATSFSSLGNYVQQKHHLEKCMAIFLARLPPTNPNLATPYFQLQGLYKRIGDLQRSLVYLHKCDAIFQKTENLNYLYVLIAFSETYSKFQNKTQQLKVLQKGLLLVDKLNGIKHTAIIYLYINVGIFYSKKNEYQNAKFYLEKGLKLSMELYGLNNNLTAITHRSFGQHYLYAANFPEALKHLQQALQFFESNKSTKPLDLCATWNYMSLVYRKKQNYLQALYYQHKALMYISHTPHIENIYDYSTIPIHIINISIKHSFLLDLIFVKAETFFDYYLYQTNSLQDLQAAQQAYNLALKFGNQIRQSFHSDDSKLIISKKIQEMAVQFPRILYTFFGTTGSEHYLYQMFDFLEVSKAYLLLQTNLEKIAKQQSSLPSQLIQSENELKTNLALLQKSIQSQTQKGDNGDKALLQKWQDDYFDAFNEFEALKEQLENDYPDYYHQKYSTSTVSLEALQSSLQENQTVLSYFIAKQKIYLFAITTDEYEVFALDKPESWKNLVQNYLQSIKHHQRNEFCEISFQLYQILLQEAIHHIIDPFEDEVKQVFIIPHAELHYLPFETLIIQEAEISAAYQDLDYLLNHCQINYHYSATLLHLDLQKQVQSIGERASHEMTFTGFAPVYESSSNAQKQALKSLQTEYATAVNRSEAVRSDGTWMPLPHSKTEVENISQLFEKEGFKSQAFLYETANKRNLEAQINKSRFVLIAAHGIVNNEYPELSGLVLASETMDDRRQMVDSGTLVANEREAKEVKNVVENSPSFDSPFGGGKGEVNGDIWNEEGERNSNSAIVEDCILNMKEVAMIPMSAELVVLSSCESGIGELHQGEGMMAVNRGFLASGAKNVVSTLFKVSDRASSELTQLLFQYILKGENYATALQKAKLELLAKEGMSPKAWSGFVLFGAGR